MRFLSFEHSKAAYLADFGLYGLSVGVLAVLLALYAPVTQRWEALALVGIGFVSWSAMEYALHRYVLHVFPVFRTWHAAHHARPRALICTPTVVSATLIALLVFLPAYLALDHWLAVAITLGVLMGYLAYAITHHAIHHWQSRNAWLEQRRYWHALHHRPNSRSACFGVTSSFWDRVFRSA